MWASGWSRSTSSWALCALLLALQSVVVHGVSFAWGPKTVVNSLYTSGQQQQQQISFQTVQSKHVLGSLLDAMQGFVTTESKAVLLLAEDAEVSLEALPSSAAGALQPLSDLLQRAPAQLTLPNTAGSVRHHLQAHTSEKTAVSECIADRHAAADALQRHADAPLLVLPLCASADATVLQHVAQQAEEALRTVAGLFIGSATPRAAARRRAQEEQAQAAPQTCDDKCKAQVRALEAFILFVVIIMAIGGGSWIMGAVDTPTRFAAPKKEHSAME